MEDGKMSIVKSFSVGEGDMFYIKYGSRCLITREIST